MIHIAAFGKISVGKSALLNALFEVDVFTVDARGGSTKKSDTRRVTFEGHSVRITDTPGIGEVNGSNRASKARRTAKSADLVIVVFDHDLTEMERVEVAALAAFGKPMLAVLNKADALRGEAKRQELRAQLCRRLKGCVANENVFVCAAAPLRRFVRDNADGSSDEWEVQGKADVKCLRKKLIAIISKEGSLLQEFRELAKSVPKMEARQRSANRKAQDLIDNYALVVAAGVAANPIPLLDLFGGGAALISLINQLADCHGTSITQKAASKLSSQLFEEGWGMLWPSMIPIVGGALLKFVPLIGWMGGAALQGAGAYYIIHVLGQASSSYFASGMRWEADLKSQLERIIAQTDKRSVMRTAQRRIIKKLSGKI